MKFNLKILSLLFVISFFLLASSANTAENYEYVDSSDLSFEIKFKDNLYSGTVTEFINPVTEKGSIIKK